MRVRCRSNDCTIDYQCSTAAGTHHRDAVAVTTADVRAGVYVRLLDLRASVFRSHRYGCGM